MGVTYVAFEVQLHGLKIESAEEIERLRREIEQAVRNLHPDLRMEGDVVVTVTETAGTVQG